MSLIAPEKLKNTLAKIETEIQEWLETETEAKAPYQVATDFENDRFLFQTDDREEFFILLFSKMSNYFEKGFLLEGIQERTEPEWHCTLHFSEGQIYLADPSIKVEFSLPSPGPHQVLRSHPAEWTLHTPEWRQMVPQGPEWTALIFEVSPQIRFLFCTQLAEPWLQLQTEKSYNFIQTSLTVAP
jgi:hypothetical protein